MTLSSVLSRLLHESRHFINHNDVSEAVLTGPASGLNHLEAAIRLLENDGMNREAGTVTVEANLTTLTQVAPVVDIDGAGAPVYGALLNWTRWFKPGDEISLAGSAIGNNGIKVVATVSSSSLTVTTPMTAAESGLSYSKTTERLRLICAEQGLYIGGYETDTELRALLAQWVTTMQRRGTRSGIVTEMNRISNSTLTTVLESVPNLTQLGTSVAYTHSTKTLAGGSWYSQLEPGESISITGSTRDSNGRYTVYGLSGSSVQIGHRANRSTEYVYTYRANKTEVLIRENRAERSLQVALANQASTSKTIGLTVTVSGATWGTGAVTQGSSTVSTSSTVATISLQTGAGSSTTRAFSEVLIPLNGLSATTTFTLAITSGSPTAVRLGDMGLCPTGTNGSPVLGSMYPWRWGGVVFTGLRSEANESGLTVYLAAKPGWYVGVTYPESAEEESYSVTFPDELAVVEVDHRNTANYNKSDLEALVRDVMLPADTEGVLGLL